MNRQAGNYHTLRSISLDRASSVSREIVGRSPNQLFKLKPLFGIIEPKNFLQTAKPIYRKVNIRTTQDRTPPKIACRRK